jgi:hypothetical protein
MEKFNDFITQIQSDEIVSRDLGEGSDWVNDWEPNTNDDDDADCIND